MKALVVGSGGREHALAWKLLQSPRIEEVVCVPGNGGTATLPGCRNVALTMDDVEGIAQVALVNNLALVVIGPEQPLADGLVDHLQAQGLAVFGPTQAGAQIEASKAWAKELMAQAKIPTAQSAVFTDAAAAIAHVQSQGVPIVVKADGLAAGKGVTVARTLDVAIDAIKAAFGGQFGAAGQQVVIEDCLEGQEVSVLAVTDGQTIRPLLPAQDHKQIGEGDTGPNTGGMGAYAPTPIVSPELLDRIQTTILEPAIATLQDRGIDYRGVLYAGLIITPSGDPMVIEFNCRFGDPETQVVLPLLETPLDQILLACVEQRLADLPPIEWKPQSAVCVVAAAEGYPGTYAKGMPITGLAAAEETGAVIFHSGTQVKAGQVVSNGGRVLGVMAQGDSFDAALAEAYGAIALVAFESCYYRRDIGFRIQATKPA
ncbi:MAG: phosphoribosylamine--glycine ligase [Cyanobacteria bacterium]|nr:phosphoribosylamine--glycine ligase [Cyanobacteriota bacterium]MDA0865543.1 phosphoribosylamine--glycine ligase [Cyanobacteriota bacterium]